MKQPKIKVDSSVKMDCHATAAAAARNDRKNAPSKNADSSNTAQSQNADSSPESTFETTPPSSRADTAPSPSLRADEIGVAIHKQQKQKGEKVDSRSNKSAKSATILSKQAKDSRICDEKSGFSSDWQGSYLSGNDRRQSRRIHDLSRKAESSSKKPTPETQKAQSSSPKQTTSTDILTCLANLSSDEVFTPPHIVNAMLDLLPQELFSDPSATFLDPACKSGVFLREIARRLMLGLEPHFPEPRKRIAHILTHQLYGIAITELTALLSRRTLYGSKDVHNRTYSIPQKSGAALPQGGNIYYAPTPHSFKNAKCTYCGASQSQYDRDSTLESHAYAFIHELEPLEQFFSKAKAHSPVIANEVKQSTNPRKVDCHADKSARNDKQSHPQGVPMSFSVIITNPPYQLSDGAGGGGSSATPLYNKFIDRAKALNPKHIVMIVPARWYSGGKGLDDFRASMLNDSRLVELHDFPNASDCFPDNAIEGGVCYFRWDSAKAESQRLLSDRGGAVANCGEAA